MKQHNQTSAPIAGIGILVTSVLFFITVFLHAQPKGTPPMDSTHNEYATLWKRIDSLSQKGLTRSAIELVNKVYATAKKQDDAQHMVKAIIHKLKFESYIEEESYIQAIHKVTEELSTTTYPVKALLHSLLANIYWSYYTHNRWLFSQRTFTESFNPQDLRTWDLKRIVDRTIYHYQRSLDQPQTLKATPIAAYDEVVIEGDSVARRLRPTLYDFLAHRAVDFFMNAEPDIIRPADIFEIDDSRYFSSFSSFAQLAISTRDTFSMPFYALRIMQDLISFHQNDTDPQALIDIDLKRLKFVKDKAVLKEKDSLYLDALLALEKKFDHHPSYAEIAYEIAFVYYRKGLTYQPLVSDTNKWMLKKALDLCTDVLEKDNGTELGINRCTYLKSRIEQRELQCTLEQVQIPHAPFRGLVTYRNLDAITLRIIRVDPRWLSRIQRNFNMEQQIQQLLKQKKIKEWTQELINDNDYQKHSLEISFPELEPGFYVILGATDAQFSVEDYQAVALTPCRVSQISYITRKDNDKGSQYYVLDRRSGKPLAGVTVTVYSQSYNYSKREYEFALKEQQTTDTNGYYLLAPSVDHYGYYIEFSHDNDTLHSDQFYNHRMHSPERQKTVRTTFFTDRAIYRPGQTIYFKGIMLETDGETTSIKPNLATTVTLYDVNYQKIESLTLTTNEYGTFQGAFTAPHGVLTGQMQISNEHGSHSISVEEYKRPRFEVTLDPVKGAYRLTDSVTISGAAEAYAGSPIDNASVRYRVVRKANMPPWFFWWRDISSGSEEMEITNGTTQTDENGAFSIGFTAIPDRSISPEDNPQFNYTIYTYVTDINGETRSAEKSIMLGYASMHIALEIPEKVDKNGKKAFSVQTTNCEGESVPVQGAITVLRLKQPQRLLRKRYWQQPDRQTLSRKSYYQLFPHDLYANEENPQTWEKENEVLSLQFDTKNDSSFTMKKLHRWEPGQYVAEATATDQHGRQITTKQYFTVYSAHDKTIPVNAYDWFFVPKTQAEPGDSVAVLFGTKAKQVHLLYEIEHQGHIIDEKWFTLTNEQRTIYVPIKESYRGNVSLRVVFVKDNRSYQHTQTITVPYTDKELDITFETFRDKLLPGQQEKWKIRIQGKRGEKAAAEMLASMYDQSLDQFVSHSWALDIYRYYHARTAWQTGHGFSAHQSSLYGVLNKAVPLRARTYDELNLFGFSLYPSAGRRPSMATASKSMGGGIAYGAGFGSGELSMQSSPPPEAAEDSDHTPSHESKKEAPAQHMPLNIRTNLNETAFFFPQLETNSSGDIVIAFTMPEALTRWRFMGLAHTKDLKTGYIEKEIITQKELMVIPNIPRFFRENDTIVVRAKMVNLSEKEFSGTAHFQLFDAATMQPVDLFDKNTQPEQDFSIPKGLSSAVSWKLVIREGSGALTCRITARTDKFSDGEETVIPVVTNKMLVTESLPISIRGKKTRTYRHENLRQSKNSSTLRHHALTLEYTTNPAWYAVQALPYLMNSTYECSEQMFSRFYANSIASHIANAHPKIKQIFQQWKQLTPEALLSNLEKNEELKSVVLEETPWVLQAQDESQRKRQIGLLFDLNRMAQELSSVIYKLEKMQTVNGGWPWFSGMPDSRHITQHIVSGMGHLNHLGIQSIKNDPHIWEMVQQAVVYIDNRIAEDYEQLLKNRADSIGQNNLSRIQIHYLYARSYFLGDIALSPHAQKAFTYYTKQAETYWLSYNRYLQGMISLALHRSGTSPVARQIIESLKENALYSEEMGMYWNDIRSGYYWYQAPIETIALMIEAFDEVAKDVQSVEAMKVWLLKNKQTNDWKTTKATAQACYALLLRGTDWLSREPDVTITVGDKEIDPKKLPDTNIEAGTGYFKTSWNASQITPSMGTVTVKKDSDGVSWGALYWQYFEQLDKIKNHTTPLALQKQLFIEKHTPSGSVIEPVTSSNRLKIGDKVIVRIELRVDRDMEYVHMKDMRAAGFEPMHVLSTYKYQDGLGYYESTKDASTHFFFSYLPKGTYVFQYPIRVNHQGDFSNGITSIQCMYAPEFTSHSQGIRVTVVE